MGERPYQAPYWLVEYLAAKGQALVPAQIFGYTPQLVETKEDKEHS